MNNYIFKNGDLHILNPENFDLAMTLDCGQAFRFKQSRDGSWTGVAGGRILDLFQDENEIIIRNMGKDEFEGRFKDYFDLSRDYKKIIDDISDNEILASASEFGKGIRILNQEPFETLCSFIISQNNNIPRIKGIIERLTKKYGKRLSDEYYDFPASDTLARLNVEDLSDIRMGFRAKYIIDAAQKVYSGEVDLKSLYEKDYETAKSELMKIKGVGPKVADCTLLFSLKHFSAFPTDVWIKRAMATLFPDGLPEKYKQYGGIIQQYIFYYARSGNIDV